MTNGSADQSLLSTKASFIQHGLAGVAPGRYRIEVQQSLHDASGDDVSGGLPSLVRAFGISPPRFALSQAAIHSVFPPVNAAGDFSTSFAHVVLETEKLPWLRSPFSPDNVPEPAVLTYSTTVDGSARTVEYDADRASWLGVVLVSPLDLGGLDPSRQVTQGTVLDLVPASLHTLDATRAAVAGALPANAYSVCSYLLEPSYSATAANPVDLGVGQSSADAVQFIDLPCALFDAIAPSLDDLAMMAHIRAVSMSNKPIAAGQTVAPEERYAVVIGNRLPESSTPGVTPPPGTPATPAGTNVALLVSFESLEFALRGHAAGSFYDTQIASRPDGVVRLVVLYQWRFTSWQDSSFEFETMLKALNGRDPTSGNDAVVVADPLLRMPGPQGSPAANDTQAIVQAMLGLGYVPLSHVTRVTPATTAAPTVQTVSWYRGPLVPAGGFVADIDFAADSTDPPAFFTADQLLRFDPNVGMYDVSYAMAWQLGRLIALANKDFSVALYRWKKQVAVQYRTLVERQALPALHVDRGDVLRRVAAPSPQAAPPAQQPSPNGAGQLADTDPPAALVTWLAKLALLQGVPFNYLVADSRLLPPESIRFFELDSTWMAALQDGAQSIGRHYSDSDSPSPHLAADQVHRPRMSAAVAETAPRIRQAQVAPSSAGDGSNGSGVISGFLLRSQVVSAWKSLEAVGYPQGLSPWDTAHGTSQGGAQPLALLRFERLSPTVVLGLFEGQVFELALHQPPEAMHFGFQTITAGTSSVTKTVRVPDSGWDDEAATFDTQSYQDQDQSLAGVFVDASSRVVDLAQVSRLLASTLSGIGKAPGYYVSTPDANHQDHLVSSDFALEMVQGVGLVSFINTPLPAQSAP